MRGGGLALQTAQPMISFAFEDRRGHIPPRWIFKFWPSPLFLSLLVSVCLSVYLTGLPVASESNWPCALPWSLDQWHTRPLSSFPLPPLLLFFFLLLLLLFLFLLLLLLCEGYWWVQSINQRMNWDRIAFGSTPGSGLGRGPATWSPRAPARRDAIVQQCNAAWAFAWPIRSDCVVIVWLSCLKFKSIAHRERL